MDYGIISFRLILSVGSNEGPHRFSRLTLEEKRTQVLIKKHIWVAFLYIRVSILYMRCDRLSEPMLIW